MDFNNLDEKQTVVGWLIAVTGIHKGQDFCLFGRQNIIGSGESCDIVLMDKEIAAYHAEIQYGEGIFMVNALEPGSKCFINRDQVLRGELVNCDILRLGAIKLRFKSLY